MVARLKFQNAVKSVFTLMSLLAGAGFLLNDPALAVAVRQPPPVPEVSSGWVLLPVVFAILLFSARQIVRRREAHSK